MVTNDDARMTKNPQTRKQKLFKNKKKEKDI
jgi:hypothetical protein